MQFGETNSATLQPDPRNAFHFSPASFAVQATQPWKLTDAMASGDRLDISGITDNLEVHLGAILAQLSVLHHALTLAAVFSVRAQARTCYCFSRLCPRKVLRALEQSLPATAVVESAFVGKVDYLSDTDIHNKVMNAISDYGIDAFKNAKLRAHSMLTKRHAFSHENEVRLVYVEQRPIDIPRDRIQVRFGV
jgi:hypothetical protein